MMALGRLPQLRWLIAWTLLLVACVDPQTGESLVCGSDADCQGPGRPGGVCHPVIKVCMPVVQPACMGSGECDDPLRPVCDLVRGRCVPCTEADGASQECSDVSGSQRPYCVNMGSGTGCVECRTSLDCPTERPICDGNACRPCEAHGECGPRVRCASGEICEDSWVCIGRDDLAGGELSRLAGQCAASGESLGQVVYARSTGCDDGSSGFTLSSPKCTLDAAVDDARRTRRPYIRLIADGTLDGPLPLSGAETQLVIIGAPLPQVPARAVISAEGTVFNVRDGATVVLDGIDAIQGGMGEATVSCYAAQLRVRSSQVRSAVPGGVGVALRQCPGSGVENSQIGPGPSIGIEVVADGLEGVYTIAGDIITGNTVAAVDLRAASPADVRLPFNTIVGNGRKGGGNGIRCPTSPVQVQPVFAYSIITGNGTPSTGSEEQFQTRGNCLFDRVVVGEAVRTPAAGQVAVDPSLTPDLRLRPAGSAAMECCIDQISPMDGLLQMDIDGQRRPYPRDGKWDLGADEWDPTF